MANEILSVRQKGDKCALVVIKLSEDGAAYTVSEGTYRRIGCPLSGDIIDKESLQILEKEDGERAALSRALKILSFGDNSERRLYSKLAAAKIKPQHARFAVEECVRLGYLCEERQLMRAVLLLAEGLLGPKKIAARLTARGYSMKKIKLTIESLSAEGKLDFKRNKHKLIEKKLGSDADVEQKQRLLYKYGY